MNSAYAQALLLLRRNLTPDGIRAASDSPQAVARNYAHLFARDVAICALGMLRSGDAELIQGARRGLLTLARFQADNGQLPKFVDVQRDIADFWYVGCIDATLWWLLAVDYFTEHAPEHELAELLSENVSRALAWLRCQEHPVMALVQQNEASDWADIMPRSGFVLYSNALWYRVKRRYGLAHATETAEHFNALFAPSVNAAPEQTRLRVLTDYVRQNPQSGALYLSFVNLFSCGTEGDVLGNLLALLFGPADDTACQRIIEALSAANIDAPYPVVSVLDPIAPTNPLWRQYMARHAQNFPHQYHNGGCWPFIGGFWVIALAQAGRLQQATDALEKIARANALNDWQFNEWLHGQSGEPAGMPGQSWNAAMFVLAYHALQGRVL
ncbi:MAG: amylo-alpha-1,6-glucosidase [Gammaproteobacteria bacterium]